MKTTLRELLALIRVGHCQLSRRQWEHDLERARTGYALSLEAERQAKVDLAMLDHERRSGPAIPQYLKLRALRPNN